MAVAGNPAAVKTKRAGRQICREAGDIAIASPLEEYVDKAESACVFYSKPTTIDSSAPPERRPRPALVGASGCSGTVPE